MKADWTLAIAAVVAFVGLNAWVLAPVRPAAPLPAGADPSLGERVMRSAGSLRPIAPAVPEKPVDAKAAPKAPADKAQAPVQVIAGIPGQPQPEQASGRPSPPSWPDSIGTVIAAALTLMVFSFLYKDNPFFRFTEALVVGIGSAIIVKETYFTVVRTKLFDRFYIPLLAGEPIGWREWMLLIPTVLSIMVLMTPSKRFYWVGRWPFAVIIGMAAGLEIPQVIDSFLLKQIEGSFTGAQGAAANLRMPRTGAEFLDQGLLIANMLFLTVGVLCVLTYFYFSAEHTGWRKPVSRVGIWILMVAFGASFGYTVMGRLSLLLRRVNFLLSDWLNLT